MITVCKNCGSALDETMQTCRDCGWPNPWCDQDSKSVVANYGRVGPIGVLLALLRDNSHLERMLLVLGALYLSFAPITLLAFSVTPWSRMPVTTRLFDAGSFILGLGDLALAIYGDLERPMWRGLARGLVLVNLLGFELFRELDRAGRL